MTGNGVCGHTGVKTNTLSIAYAAEHPFCQQFQEDNQVSEMTSERLIVFTGSQS